MTSAASEVPSEAMLLRPSKYNVAVSLPDRGGAIYNRRTGACVALQAPAFEAVERRLREPSVTVRDLRVATNVPGVAARLVAGGFLVKPTYDEVGAIRARLIEGRRNSALALTIYPTYACNLGCDYCVVGKKSGTMSRETEALLVAFVEHRLRAAGHRSMGVAWFGGEPLIAPRVIERLSIAFVDACSRMGATYSAQLVTNGTLVTKDVAARLVKCRISRAQITLDGEQVTHDARRGWRKGSRSSYRDVIAGLRVLIGRMPVRLRINVDRRNVSEVPRLLRFFGDQGWLSPAARFYPYVARVLDYTDASARIAEYVCDPQTFEALEEWWLRSLHAHGVSVALRPLYGFPEPRAVTCTALTSSGFVIAPHGGIYRCSFDADEESRASASLRDGCLSNSESARFWDMYDPLARAECRDCDALPSCLGVCPRNFRDGRSELIRDNCRHFREVEPRAIRRHLMLTTEVGAKGSAGTSPPYS